MAVAAFLGALFANGAGCLLLWQLSLPETVLYASMFALVEALGAWLGAEWLGRSCGGTDALRRGPTFIRFVAVAALVVPLFGALWAAGVLFAAGYLPIATFDLAWKTCWLSLSTGTLVFAPLVLAWSGVVSQRFRGWSGVEAVATFVVFSLLTGWVIRYFLSAPPGQGFPRP
jgi:integral membrane sensor domain MASE1